MKFTNSMLSWLFACYLPVASALPTGSIGSAVGLGEAVNLPAKLDLKRPIKDSNITTRVTETNSQIAQQAVATTTTAIDTLPVRLAINNPLGELLFHEIEIAPGVRIVEHEWLIWLSGQTLPTFSQQGIALLEQKRLRGLDITYLRIKAESAQDNRAYIQSLFGDNDRINIQRNFIFSAQSAAQSKAESMAEPVHSKPTDKSLQWPRCVQPMKVGMIDTAINPNHPSLINATIERQSFVHDTLSEPLGHGTSIASLLVGNSADYQGVIANAHLFAASVFYQRDAYSQGASTESLVNALDWLVGHQVSVINMSLAGPDDPLLAFAIDALSNTKTVIVAAVGNAGPASKPLYPAAYPHTVAVTAIDDQQAIYRWAVQGEHVDIAAAGVAVNVARASGGFARESGTSLAAPIVSGFLACYLAATTEPWSLETVLADYSVDLGEPGKDPVFGVGRLLSP